MRRDPSKSTHSWRGVLTSLALGGCVFYLGRTVAVWLTAHNVHGFSAFLDNVAAGAAACLVVLFYERRRQRSERELLESEENLALLLESTAEGIFGIDLEARLTFCNPACLRMLGYEYYDELLGKNIHDLIHHTRPDGTPYPAEECPILKSLRAGVGAAISDEVLWRADGTSFHAEYWSSPQRRRGQVIGAVVAFIDITARKRTEEALRKSEETFSKAFRRSPMSLTITSTKDHRYIDVNETYERITGWRREEIIGRTPLDIGLYVDPAERLELVNRALTAGRFCNQEIRFRMRDGSIRAALMSGELITLDGEPCLLNVGADVTDYKHVEEALKKSEEKFSKAFRESPMALILTSAKDHRYIEVNETFLRLTGHSREEVLGRTPFDLNLWVDPSKRLQFVQQLQAQGSVRDLEVVFRRKDGSTGVGLASAELIEVDGEQLVLAAAADITESKQAERALRESEEKFRRVFQDSATGMVMLSPEGRFLTANRAFCEFVGYSEQELIGRDVLSFTHPEDQAASSEAMDRALAGKSGSQRFEKRYLHKNGQVLWGEVSPTLIRDCEGQPEYLVSQVLDISARKRAEEALRKSEEKFSKTFRESPMAITLTSAKDHRYIDVNESWERMTGYSREEAIGRTVFELGLWPDPAVRVEAVNRLLAEGRLRDFEYVIRARDGSIGFYLASAELIEIDGEQLVLGVIADVTERKRAEQALRESEEKFRTVFRSAPTGMLMLSPEGRILAANQAFCEFLGYSEKELLSEDIQSVTYPEERALSLQAMKEALVGDFGSQRFEKRYLHKSGQILWGEVRTSSIRKSEGKPEYFVSQIVNITERKRVEEELRQRESELKEAQRVAQIGSWTRDPESDAITWSDEMYRIHGRDPSLPPPRFTELAQFFTAGSWERLNAIREEFWQTGGIASIDLEAIRPDGSKRWVSTRGEAERDASGRIVRYRGTAQDVTERRQVEEALRESEERFRRVVEHIGDAIVVDDVYGHVVFANDQFLNLFGFRREELHNLKLEDYIAPEYRAQLRDRHDRRMKGEAMPAHFEYEGCRRDGTRMWLEVDVVPVRAQDGKLAGTQSAVRDITERKQAEQALRESEERFRLVANAAPVMIWKAGPDKLCNYFNQSWLEFSGRPLETQLGNGWAQSVHPDDLPKCLETYTQSFDCRVPFRMEYRLRRHDGEYRWIDDTGAPIFNPDGSFVGYIGSCVDITDRKRGEEALRTVSGKLIEAQEKERKRIARELHDDINQRLAMLAIEIQQLKDIPRLSAAQIRQRSEELFQRTTEISSDIQLLSHDLHSSSLEYLGLVPAMRGFCTEFAKRQKVEVDFGYSNVPSSLSPEVALGLFRILQEALHNAVKHSGVGKFEARLMGVARGIQLTIRDSGKGLDLEAAMSGHGLGLISMRERVNLLKGTISIVSKPKHGTEITVRIPEVAETGASQQATA